MYYISIGSTGCCKVQMTNKWQHFRLTYFQLIGFSGFAVQCLVACCKIIQENKKKKKYEKSFFVCVVYGVFCCFVRSQKRGISGWGRRDVTSCLLLRYDRFMYICELLCIFGLGLYCGLSEKIIFFFIMI